MNNWINFFFLTDKSFSVCFDYSFVKYFQIESITPEFVILYFNINWFHHGGGGGGGGEEPPYIFPMHVW